MFFFHTTLQKFENRAIIDHFGFVFEENAARKIACLLWRHSFRTAPFLKCFPSTLKRKASVFKFLRFEERFPKAPFSWRLVWTVGLTVEIKKLKMHFKFLWLNVDGTFNRPFRIPLLGVAAERGWGGQFYTFLVYFSNLTPNLPVCPLECVERGKVYSCSVDCCSKCFRKSLTTSFLSILLRAEHSWPTVRSLLLAKIHSNSKLVGLMGFSGLKSL